MQQVLIHQNLIKRLGKNIASLKSNISKLDVDKLRNVPSHLSNLKNKVDKLDLDNLVPFPLDLSKLSDIVKSNIVKIDVYNAKIKEF